jgi:hypothetical protein
VTNYDYSVNIARFLPVTSQALSQRLFENHSVHIVHGACADLISNLGGSLVGGRAANWKFGEKGHSIHCNPELLYSARPGRRGGR